MLRSGPALLLASLVLSLTSVPRTAYALPMDPTVHRLGIAGGNDYRPCSLDGTTIRSDGGVTQCFADDATYQRMMLQLGTAIASPGLSPARTVGYRHFYMGVETSHTRLNGMNASMVPPDPATGSSAEWQAWREQNFMRLATSGDRPDPGDPAAVASFYNNGNRFASNGLTWLRLAFRKGLPFGLEVGGSAGRLIDTSVWVFTFDVKWSLLEGFRRRWPAMFPDFAVRASVSSLAGVNGFTLTVPTADVIISKGFVLGHAVTVSPYVSGQIMWLMADSEVVDVTPGSLTDNDGRESLVVFDRIRAWHPRILAGLQIQYSRFVLNGAFRYDLGNPARGLDAITTDMPKQWTVDVGVGVTY